MTPLPIRVILPHMQASASVRGVRLWAKATGADEGLSHVLAWLGEILVGHGVSEDTVVQIEIDPVELRTLLRREMAPVVLSPLEPAPAVQLPLIPLPPADEPAERVIGRMRHGGMA